MNTTKRIVATIALFGTIASTAFAGPPHTNLPTCYAHVNSGCFVDQTTPCTDEEYQGFLDNCHETYPSGSRPSGIGNFKVIQMKKPARAFVKG
jgi:hypothetical protein